MSNEYIKANPCHPGKHLRECIRMEGLTVKAAAESIGVSRILLNRMLRGESSVTTKTALALERLGWGKAEFANAPWLGTSPARGGGYGHAPNRAFSGRRRCKRMRRLEGCGLKGEVDSISQRLDARRLTQRLAPHIHCILTELETMQIGRDMNLPSHRLYPL